MLFAGHTPNLEPPLAARRNLEIKARLASLDAVRCVAESVATDYLGVQWQTDTYFHCQHGRLKLREIESQPAMLIAYTRPDEPWAKGSEYYLIPVSHPTELKYGLAAALGIARVVTKRREIFLVDNVRVHLDEVDGLGTFLEFEVVIVDDNAARRAPSQIAALLAKFHIKPQDLVSGSYAEMP